MTPEDLENSYEEFVKIPKENGTIQKDFLWWPDGTDENEIFKWFDEKYPGGLRKLLNKRMSKKVGVDEKEYWEKLERALKRTSPAHLLSIVPVLADVREYSKEHRHNYNNIKENGT